MLITHPVERVLRCFDGYPKAVIERVVPPEVIELRNRRRAAGVAVA